MPNQEFMIEITYNGLWALYQWANSEVERIEAIDADQRGMTDVLSLPHLLEARAHYWRKISGHNLYQTGKYL